MTVRIVIAGPPKTGNMWLKCLLGRAYGLRWLRSFETPVSADFPSLRTWLADGRFPDGTIFHQHYDYSAEVADALDAVPAHVVTIVRSTVPSGRGTSDSVVGSRSCQPVHL